MLRIGALGFVLVAALLPVPTAGAAKPITTVDSFDRTFTFQCPQGFTLIERYQGTETIRRFADGRQHTAVRLVSEFTNGSSGETLTAITPSLYTFTADTVSVVGVTFRLTVPGEGTISLDAGRLVYDRQSGTTIFDSGPSDGRPNLCVVLTGR
jgi:hypothetical protein